MVEVIDEKARTSDYSRRIAADGSGARRMRIVYSNSDYSDAPLTLRGYEAWRSVSVASDKSELHLGEVRGQSPAAGLISTQSMQSRRMRRGVCEKPAHGDSPHLG